MSYHIEFRHQAFKIQPEEIDAALEAAGIEDDGKYGRTLKNYGNPIYVIWVEGGDNNLICNETNRVARDWYVNQIGTEYDIMRSACDMAKTAEGGGLRLGTRPSSAESYLRKYRSLIRNARPAAEAEFPCAGFKISIPSKTYIDHSELPLYAELKAAQESGDFDNLPYFTREFLDDAEEEVRFGDHQFSARGGLRSAKGIVTLAWLAEMDRQGKRGWMIG